MTYRLLVGQKSYSSWSLRGWLCFAPFDIPVEMHSAVIYSREFYTTVAEFGGEATVPCAITPEGGRLTDSLSIAWHLSERFHDRGLLPDDAADRAEALSLIAEMHAGFTSLRADCPMNLRTAWADFQPSDAVLADAARAEELWARALEKSGGPFLYGNFTLADAFYAPPVTRLLTYGLPMTDRTAAYAKAMMNHPAIRRWRDEGLQEDAEVAYYDMAPLARVPFPSL